MVVGLERLAAVVERVALVEMGERLLVVAEVSGDGVPAADITMAG